MLEIYLSSCSSSARYLQFISYFMLNNIVTSKSYCNFKSCKYAVNWFWKSLPRGKSVKSFVFGICICLWVFEVRSWGLGSVDIFWKIWWLRKGLWYFLFTPCCAILDRPFLYFIISESSTPFFRFWVTVDGKHTWCVRGERGRGSEERGGLLAV